MKISIVTPVYNAVNIVDELYKQLVENVSRITDDFEIVMVNDACPYGSGEKITALGISQDMGLAEVQRGLSCQSQACLRSDENKRFAVPKKQAFKGSSFDQAET